MTFAVSLATDINSIKFRDIADSRKLLHVMPYTDRRMIRKELFRGTRSHMRPTYEKCLSMEGI